MKDIAIHLKKMHYLIYYRIINIFYNNTIIECLLYESNIDYILSSIKLLNYYLKFNSIEINIIKDVNKISILYFNNLIDLGVFFSDIIFLNSLILLFLNY